MSKTIKNVYALFALFAALFCTFFFSACETVAPAAWITLKTDGGTVYYSTDMYASTRPHIRYYENEEDEENGRPAIEIEFSPRILGPDEVDGVKTTLVDVAGFYAMYITVFKDRTIYSPDKAFYLNGSETPLVPYKTHDEYSSFASYEFEEFGLVRGNPGGRLNGFINVLEYK